MKIACPACPDGNEWTRNGPTGRPCHNCNGRAYINTDCIGEDPLCPCQDGDACHYRDTPTSKAMPIPNKGKS